MTAKKSASKQNAKRPSAKTAVAPRKSSTVKKTTRSTTQSKAASKSRAPSKAAPKKAAAAKSPAKPTESTPFDIEKRRKLIAAAAARRRKAVASQRIATKPVILEHREPTRIEKHKFSVGDGVRVISTAGMWFKNGIDYTITAALPPTAGKLQYRIKNEGEPFERVVAESQLMST